MLFRLELLSRNWKCYKNVSVSLTGRSSVGHSFFFDSCPWAVTPDSHFAAESQPCRQDRHIRSAEWYPHYNPPAGRHGNCHPGASLYLPNKLPCEMQMRTVWKLVKENRRWGCRYVKYSCAHWKSERGRVRRGEREGGDSMSGRTKGCPWHAYYYCVLLYIERMEQALHTWPSYWETTINHQVIWMCLHTENITKTIGPYISKSV